MDISDIAINATILVIKWAESSSETEAEEIRRIIAELCQTVIDKFKGDLCVEQTLAHIIVFNITDLTYHTGIWESTFELKRGLLSYQRSYL